MPAGFCENTDSVEMFRERFSGVGRGVWSCRFKGVCGGTWPKSSLTLSSVTLQSPQLSDSTSGRPEMSDLLTHE